jgi:hypothetical protein
VAAGGNAALTAAANLALHGGAVARLVGSMVHLNPPGAAPPQVQPKIPATPDSAWSRKEVPRPAKGSSTADAPTPRRKG